MTGCAEEARYNTRQSPYLPGSPPQPSNRRSHAGLDTSRRSDVHGTPLQLLSASRSVDQSAATTATLAELQDELEAERERAERTRRRASFGDDSGLAAVPEDSVLGSPAPTPPRGGQQVSEHRYGGTDGAEGAGGGSRLNSSTSSAGGGGRSFNGRNSGFNTAAVPQSGNSFGVRSQGPSPGVRSSVPYADHASRPGVTGNSNSALTARWRAKYSRS